MEGRDVRRGLAPDGTERVLINSGESGRLTAYALCRELEHAGLACVPDEILSDPGAEPSVTSLQRLDTSAICIVVMSRRCSAAGWRDRLLQHSLELGLPGIVFFEGVEQEWSGEAVPSMVTSGSAAVLAFLARSKPDMAGLREFAGKLLGGNAIMREFGRPDPARWNWQRQCERQDDLPPAELSLVDEIQAATPRSEVIGIEARAEGGMPVVYLGSSDLKRYRLAYSREIRAVLPAPAMPAMDAIGFMHCDFDTGREWPRAGEPAVEIRLLGREVYGWHMSEYFWRAFVNSLPKLLDGSDEVQAVSRMPT